MCDCRRDLVELAKLERERVKLAERISELRRKTFAHEFVGLSKPHPPDNAAYNVN